MTKQPAAPVCGIVMPISLTDEAHTPEHWAEVLSMLEEAITEAGLQPKPVWIAGETNIIQAKILKNLFENDLVICDVSTLNPNVMLEFGMRLTTRKPTVVVAEIGTKLPFDTSSIKTIFYEPSLRHSAVKLFVQELTDELLSAKAAQAEGTYRSFLEHMTFERVEPNTVTVRADQVIERRLDEMSLGFRRLEQLFRDVIAHKSPETIAQEISEQNDRIRRALDALPHNTGYVVGSRVFHQKFGFGTVAEIEGNKLIVDFDSFGRKSVISTFVEIVDKF